MYYVEIKLHPAVQKLIENTFNKVDDIYDFRRHLLYNFISIALCRSSVKLPSLLPVHYEKLKTIKVAITSWDFNNIGKEIPPKQQMLISNLMYKQILYDACYRIMICHIYGNLPRDTAIKNYLAENGFEEYELNYAALRKHYQRNWIEIEKVNKENYHDFNTFLSRNKPLFDTKKNLKFVPNSRKTKK